MTNWTTEKELADQLRQLTEKVRRLQDEIRGDALAVRRPTGPTMPIDEESRIRDVRPSPAEKDPEREPDR